MNQTTCLSLVRPGAKLVRDLVNPSAPPFLTALFAGGLAIAEDPHAKKWPSAFVWGSLALTGALSLWGSSFPSEANCEVHRDDPALVQKVHRFREWIKDAGGDLNGVEIRKSEVRSENHVF